MRLLIHDTPLRRQVKPAGPLRTSRGKTIFPNMPRYAALLRGVMPMNAKMAELRAAFEAAGFTEVKTVLSSGNVVFSAPRAAEAALEQQAEAAMLRHLGRGFFTIVRSIDTLRELLKSDPYRAFRLPSGSKRIVTFLRGRPRAGIKLPVEQDGARIHATRDREIFSSYVRTPKGPVFMSLIERTFGKDQTTRTWDTVAKIVR
jgi:uncharacterized protein (DUF1697 family)